MSNLQTCYHFKLEFQKVDQHTGGKLYRHDIMFVIIIPCPNPSQTLLE